MDNSELTKRSQGEAVLSQTTSLIVSKGPPTKVVAASSGRRSEETADIVRVDQRIDPQDRNWLYQLVQFDGKLLSVAQKELFRFPYSRHIDFVVQLI